MPQQPRTEAPRLTVRRAEKEDLSAVLSMENECFSDPYTEGSVLSALLSPVAKNLMIFSGDRPVGYLLATEVCDEAEILRIAVCRDFRRRGIARDLLAAFLRDRKEDGVCFLEVRHSNEAAIALYTSAGFTVYGRRKNYYKNPSEDALLLRFPPEKEPI